MTISMVMFPWPGSDLAWVRAPGAKVPSSFMPNQAPNSSALARARHTRERGARRTICFSMRSVVLCNFMVASYGGYHRNATEQLHVSLAPDQFLNSRRRSRVYLAAATPCTLRNSLRHRLEVLELRGMPLAECRIKGPRVQSQLDFGEVLATDSLVGRRKHPVRSFQHSVNRPEQLQS